MSSLRTTLAAALAVLVAAGCGGSSSQSSPLPDCTRDDQCDDGRFCNGAERCVGGTCQAGTPPSCDDGIACTTDSCDPGTNACVHTPSNAACDDGRFCNGAETCSVTLGCVPGTPPSCDDGVACTQDACDPGADACQHVPVSSSCSDGQFCNGAEVCDALEGCKPGTPPSCDDGIACTVDSCDNGLAACAHTPTDALCDDGLFCDGVETCAPAAPGANPTSGCLAGTAPDCDDAIACTVDSCSEGMKACAHTPSDAACADGFACNGAEVCDVATGCVAGTPLPQAPAVYALSPAVAFAGIPTPASVYLAGAVAGVDAVTLSTVGGAPIAVPFTWDPARPARVAVTVPAGLPAGSYALDVVHGASCSSASAVLSVVSSVTFAVASVDPATAWTGADTRITVTASPAFGADPVRVYLARAGADAVPLDAVVRDSATRLRATLRAGTPAGAYDVVVVAADGAVGVAPAALTVVGSPPPVVAAFSPAYAVPSTAAITVAGRDLRAPTVSLTCLTDVATGATVTVPASVVSFTSTSLTFSAAPLASAAFPGACDVAVTNSDGARAVYRGYPLAAASGALAPSIASAPLPVPVRAPAVAAVSSPSGRFLVCAGGDTGFLPGTSNVFVSPVGPAGPTGWAAQRASLPAALTYAAGAGLGRYVYVVGGMDAAGTPRAEVYRAALLDPASAPRIVDVDLAPASSGGLSQGTWQYRVSALKPPTDPDDPSGESVGSLPATASVPATAAKVTLTWSAVPGAVGYRVFRSAAPGDPSTVLVAEVSAPWTTWTDTAATAPGSFVPLEDGALGNWQTLPSLGTGRELAAAVVVYDPALASTATLYALQGFRSLALGTSEALAIGVGADGRQTPAAAWTDAGTGTARYAHAAVALDAEGAAAIGSNQHFVTVVGGTTNGGGTILDTADTATFSASAPTLSFSTGQTSTSFQYGQGAAVAAGRLFVFGGPNGATGVSTCSVGAGTPPTFGSVNAASVPLSTGRYLPGVVRVGPTIVVVGGWTGSAATATTETFVW